MTVRVQITQGPHRRQPAVQGNLTMLPHLPVSGIAASLTAMDRPVQ